MQPIKLQNHNPPPGKTSNHSLPPADLETDEGLYPVKPRSSAIRYTDAYGNQVIERGNKRMIVHEEPPPKQRRSNIHWLLVFGVGMILTLLLVAALNALSSWWTQHQLDTTYEFPRISQADAVVYPGDTTEHPSHYLFLNLQGTVLIVELPHGDSAHAHIYKGPTLFSQDADQVPVTGEFRVVNGTVEMLVHIQDKTILYLFNGTQFITQ